KLSEFLVQVFGSERSNDEFDQLKTWKNEGELNAKSLQEMTALNLISTELSDYQDFDVEAGLANTLEQITPDDQHTTTQQTKTILVITITILALLASFGLYKVVMEQPHQYYADSDIIQRTLDDGTNFTLNDESSLTYDDVNNSMSLNGEAFFDVVKQDIPLIIKTSQGQIKVLGTSFNVKSDEEVTEVYMYNGTIEYTSDKKQSIKVTEGEGIIVTSSAIKKFASENVQVYNYWIDQRLSYKNVPFANVLDDLERLFDKDYSDLKQSSNDLTVTANFENNTELEILEELSVITGIKL
ncbi:FecR family protein, partial [Saprospiraceae bacterium]|nr:FecR family protein [Saprospiraceae bacterium]